MRRGLRRIGDFISSRYPLMWVLVVWLALMLLLPEQRGLTNAYLVLLLLPFLLMLSREDAKKLAGSWVIRFAALFMISMYVSVFWNEPSLRMSVRLSQDGLANFSFLIVMTGLLAADERRERTIFLSLGCLMLIVGGVSAFNHLFGPPTDLRFSVGPWANVNTGAVMLGLVATGLLAGLPRQPRPTVTALISVAPALAIIALLVATQSRGPMLALLIALVVAGLTDSSRRLVLGALAAAAMAFALANYFGAVDFFAWLGRADAQRLTLWSHYGGLAVGRLATGHGINNEFAFRFGPLVDSPHNMLLSALFYGGVAAAIAYAGLMLASLRAGLLSVVRHRHALPLALVVYIAVHGLFESAIPFHAASWIWLYFWIPLAVAAAAELRENRLAITIGDGSR